MDTVVIFRCGDVRCALDRADVAEVTPLPDLSAPPSMPATFAGFLNLGGEALPVVDTARLLGVTPDPDQDPLYRHVLVVRSGNGGLIGLLVDRVEDVRPVPAESRLPHAPGQSLNDAVIGEIALADGRAHMLAAGRLLLAAEAARLSDLRAIEQARLDQLAPT